MATPEMTKIVVSMAASSTVCALILMLRRQCGEFDDRLLVVRSTDMQIIPNQPAPIMDRPAIDGLRGLACLIVLVFHAIAQNKPEWGVYITGTARLGVWLFFVLSAFLLTLRLLDKGFGRAGLTDYVVARVLRIIPLFVAAVLLYWWAGLIGLVSWQDVVKALTFQAYYNHLWTIPIEFMFYGLLLPIVLVVNWIFRRSIAGGAATLTLAIVAAAIAFRPATPDDIVLWNYLACFGWGILAAFSVRYVPKHLTASAKR